MSFEKFQAIPAAHENWSKLPQTKTFLKSVLFLSSVLFIQNEFV